MDPASDSIPRTGNPIFTSLPREIRVCIYKAAFDTNGNLNSDVDTFQLFTVGKSKLTPFAVIAHKWAARSRVAREACITFYEHKMFDLNAKAIQDLIPDSFARTVAQQLNILGCKNFTSFQDIDKPLSLSIEPRPYLRNLHIYLMDRNYDPWSDLRLPALSELLRCPNLKYVSIRIWAFDVVNPFPEALPAIQLISEVCKTLKEKIGGNKENPWPRFSSRFSSSARGLNVCVHREKHALREFEG